MAKKKDDGTKIIADNRKARFAYAIEDSLEAGIALVGSEVKSLRGGKSTIAESYAQAKDGELEQAPLKQISVQAQGTLRVEPYTTPLRVVPLQ